MGNELNLEGLIGALGGSPAAAEDNPPATDDNPPAQDPPPASDDGGQQDPPPEGGDTGAGADTGAEQQDPPPAPDNKAAAAFAQMRLQNKKYESLFKGLAGVLGAEATDDPDKLMDALNEKLIEAQAKQQNLPPEVLQRLQKLEQENQMYTADQLKQTAYLGFQKVKDQFGLDDKALSQFADTLVADGVNPFEQPVDLITEYKVRNFETLMQQAIEKGVQQEMERAAKANAHSTNPGSGTGARGEQQDGKITTAAGLEKFFSDNLNK